MKLQKKSITLIIVIFLMLVFSVMGTTLLIMQSGDFEFNLRNFELEKALYIAESGIEWAMREVADNFDCDFDGDGKDIYSGTVLHNLGNNQYRVDCACSDNQCSSSITLISSGFMSQESNYRTMRIVEVDITKGAFTNVLTGGDLFDWHNTKVQPAGSNYDVDIDGNLQSPRFEGRDSDTQTYPDEETSDDDLAIPGDGSRTIDSTSLPSIDMAYFEDYAVTGGKVYSGNKTFDKNDNLNNKGVYYVKGDVTIDLTSGNVNLNHTSIIAEGDITIIGDNSLAAKAYVDMSKHETFPNLATKNGDITFVHVPAGSTDKKKRDARKFDGLIFSKNGDVDINYINGIAVMGKNIILRGSIDLQYNDKYVDTAGFIQGTLSVIRWQEK